MYYNLMNGNESETGRKSIGVLALIYSVCMYVVHNYSVLIELKMAPCRLGLGRHTGAALMVEIGC